MKQQSEFKRWGKECNTMYFETANISESIQVNFYRKILQGNTETKFLIGSEIYDLSALVLTEQKDRAGKNRD